MGLSPARLAERGLRAITARARLLPDFLIIGAQKGGTTSLYEYLAAHPCVGPAAIKEVHFFDLKWDRGVSWYRAQFPTAQEKRRAEQATGQPFLTGEATPYYLYHPPAAERAFSVVPAARLIVMLRNPADRAYSHYQHERRAGREPLSFEEALEREVERLAEEPEAMTGRAEFSSGRRRHSYLARGRYAEQLERWLARFPREQLLILNSERFYADPAAATEQACRFLGLPPPAQAEYPRHNPGSYRGGMEPATRRRLLDHFAPENERLFRLLGERYDWDE
ncbi:MAG TPA: sulfotransferase domain-containing protein [Armatimonadota bacterium]|nr:sulfotransferase domain-containing protein [Armatimonadota bacterium]